jgi:N-acetylglucosamine kinase-like BadF-type ATPase
MIGLGIDAGGGSTRWLLLTGEGKTLATGSLEATSGHIFTPQDRERNFSRLVRLCQDVLKIAKPDAVVGGLTGLYPNTEGSSILSQLVADTLGLEVNKVHLTNDMHVAFAAAFGPGEGVLVYAGTGSVGYHETATGEIVSAGGYGYLIDDYGAGYWIGHEAIKQTMRWVDEFGKPSEALLAKYVYEELGGSDWEHVLSVIYGENPRTILARLVPAVVKAAHAGDEAAISILQNAGRELARLANVILKRLGNTLPVAFSGGISKASPFLTEALKNALPSGTVFQTVTTEPVEAAAKLALRLVNRL